MAQLKNASWLAAWTGRVEVVPVEKSPWEMRKPSSVYFLSHRSPSCAGPPHTEVWIHHRASFIPWLFFSSF